MPGSGAPAFLGPAEFVRSGEALRRGWTPGCRPRVHPLAGHPPLRELPRGQLSAAQTAAPGFLQRVRLLPLGRRPGRRNRRPRREPAPAGVVARANWTPCTQGRATHPVFVALRRHRAPARHPARAVSRSDLAPSSRTRPSRATAIGTSVFDYCRYSANPVGRLVLHLCGYSDAERQRLSDATCTALQLANFWQDVTVDALKDRVYLPLDLLARHGYTVDELFARRFTPGLPRGHAGSRRPGPRAVPGGVAAGRHGWTGGWRSISTCSAAAACGCSRRSNGGTTTCSPRAQRSPSAERVRLLLGSLARAAFRRAAR